MKNVLFICDLNGLKFDLQQLTAANTQFMLISTTAARQRISDEQIAFFNSYDEVDSLSFEKCVKIIRERLQDENALQAIVTCDEPAVMLCAKLREIFKVPGQNPANAELFLNKDKMKAKLAAAGVRVPRYHLFDKNRYQKEGSSYLQEVVDETTQFPLFVKPIDNYGANHCKKIRNTQELHEFAEAATHDDQHYEIDEYIEGTLYHVDAAVKAGEIIYTAIGEYLAPLHVIGEGKNIGTMPLLSDCENWQTLVDYNKKIISLLDAPDGMTHLELFVTQNQEIVFLEIASRPGGGLIPPTHRHNFNFDTYLAHFQLGIGGEYCVESTTPTQFAAGGFFPTLPGKVCKLHEPLMASQFSVDWHVRVGDHIHRAINISPLSNSFAGTFMLYNKNYATLREDYASLVNFQAIEVVEVSNSATT